MLELELIKNEDITRIRAAENTRHHSRQLGRFEDKRRCLMTGEMVFDVVDANLSLVICLILNLHMDTRQQ